MHECYQGIEEPRQTANYRVFTHQLNDSPDAQYEPAQRQLRATDFESHFAGLFIRITNSKFYSIDH